MELKSIFQITVYQGKEQSVITCKEDENLLEALRGQGIYINADCGGRGTCGQCLVKLLEGSLTEINSCRDKVTRIGGKGYYLACNSKPIEDCVIEIEANQDQYEIIMQSKETMDKNNNIEKKKEEYLIGIDLGTTTLAFHLVDLHSKDIIDTYTTVNRQRSYGADVISRIQASNQGGREQLQHIICEEIKKGIQILCEKVEFSFAFIKQIVIAGNTTMVHLLMGYSCTSLGVYPFTPYHNDTIHTNTKDLFHTKEWNIPVVVLPGFTTFVGGDIVAGLLYTGFDKSDNVNLFIDLGTNGEMAIGNKDKILVSSTAAGPAFEGGNISCGVGSIPGAISKVTINKDNIQYETISNQPPIGICGTGIVELISELLKEELIDDTGLLVEPYFEQGYPATPNVVLTQKDIRELQMAKAAICTGIELLIKAYGISERQVDTVYLAGGFGYKIDIKKAVHIGLIPEALEERIELIGNSSLAGAIQYGVDKTSEERIRILRSITEEIHLSNDLQFNDKYLEHMYFIKN